MAFLGKLQFIEHNLLSLKNLRKLFKKIENQKVETQESLINQTLRCSEIPTSSKTSHFTDRNFKALIALDA